MFKQNFYLGALCATLTTLSCVSTAVAEVNGFTVGADYGRTEAKKYCDHITNCENSDNGPKIEVGYDFNQNFGLELGYTSFGTIFESNDSSASIKQESNAITFSAIGTIPLGEWFGVYGRFGYARYDSNNTGSIAGVPVKDETGNTPFWGAGAKVNLNEQFAIRVEYQSYKDLSDAPGRDDDVQGLFAGVVYRF
ncbi:MAG: porin [Pseudomonadota bacterium]